MDTTFSVLVKTDMKEHFLLKYKCYNCKAIPKLGSKIYICPPCQKYKCSTCYTICYHHPLYDESHPECQMKMLEFLQVCDTENSKEIAKSSLSSQIPLFQLFSFRKWLQRRSN